MRLPDQDDADDKDPERNDEDGEEEGLDDGERGGDDPTEPGRQHVGSQGHDRCRNDEDAVRQDPTDQEEERGGEAEPGQVQIDLEPARELPAAVDVAARRAAPPKGYPASAPAGDRGSRS